MTSSLWQESTVHTAKPALIVSVGVAVVAVAISFAAPHLGTIGAPTSHVAGEVISAILSIVVGFTLITISGSTEQRWFRLLGWGFVASAGFDLLHGITSSTAATEAVSGFALFSEWASLVGRLALAGFALCAVTAQQKRPDGQEKYSYVRASLLAVLVVGAAALIAFAQASSKLVFSPESSLSIVPGVLFLSAFVMVQRRQSTSRYTFMAFPVFLLASGAADSGFMVHSTEQLDGYYAGHHMFKLFASGIMLVGLLAESQRLHSFEVRAREELGRINESLNVSNLNLTSAGNDLRVLNQIGRIAGVSSSVADQFDEIGALIQSRIDADRVGIAIVDETGTSCTIEAVHGLHLAGRAVGTVFDITGTNYGEVMLGRKTMIIDDATIADAIERVPRFKFDVGAGIKSWLSTPIVVENKVVGLLLARSTKPFAYGEREAQFIEQVASQLAGPVSHGRGRRARAA